MASESTKKAVKKLKSLDLGKCAVTFWLVKRAVVRREANYGVLRVDIDVRLQRKFKSYFGAQLQNRDFHISEYQFSTADGDDVLLSIDAELTDFPKVEEAIGRGFENSRVTKSAELLNSWAYVIQFECDGKSIYAWRKINAMTQPKRVLQRKALFFQNQKLVDVDDEEVFLIDPHFDFFVFDGVVLIASKRDFESSMNFREGMKKHGEELLSEFQSMAFLSDISRIRDYVGDNLHHLRKLASIRKAGYYKQPGYLDRLAKVSDTEKWGLEIVDGKVIVEEETIELLLKLLNNDRLRSPINDELFDSAAKSPVAGKRTS